MGARSFAAARIAVPAIALVLWAVPARQVTAVGVGASTPTHTTVVTPTPVSATFTPRPTPTLSQSYGVGPDHPAAIVIFPYVVFDSARGIDTIVRLSSTFDAPLEVLCLFEIPDSRCSEEPFAVCHTANDCNGGQCIPQWTEVDFPIRLAPNQPFEWRLSGVGELPLSPGVCSDTRLVCLGDADCAPNGRGSCLTNFGSRPQAAQGDPFTGVLRCLAVDVDDDRLIVAPAAANVLSGTATIETVHAEEPSVFDVARYNAVGIPAVIAGNGDGSLELGTEYDACPRILRLNHIFDGKSVAAGTVTETTLAVVPCSVDYLRQIPGETTVEPIAYNELGERQTLESFSVSAQAVRSLSSLGVETAKCVGGDRAGQACNAGECPGGECVGIGASLTGQLTLRGENGIVGVAIETHRKVTEPEQFSSAARALHSSGRNPTPEIIWAPFEGRPAPTASAVPTGPTATRTPTASAGPMSPTATPTVTRSPTLPSTATRTPTLSDTPPTSGTPATPHPTATMPMDTATPAVSTPTRVPIPCGGDCDGDESVTVDEVVRGVAIALGNRPATDCPAFDGDGNNEVTVEEIVRAIAHALGGCR